MNRALILTLAAAVTLLAAAPPPAPRRIPAGKDAAGNTLTVLVTRGKVRTYQLEKSRDGKVLSTDTIVTIHTFDNERDEGRPLETGVAVAPNRITVSQDGGVATGNNFTAAFQLSPWMPLTWEGCLFSPNADFTHQKWNWANLRGRSWVGTPDDHADGICVDDPSLLKSFVVPTVAVDATRLERDRVRLGSCALTLDASGNNGWIVWGKPNPAEPVEVKLLLTGPRTLIVQVVDPSHQPHPNSRSWIHSDHIELWMGSRLKEIGEVWQFGIPLDEGNIEIGYGLPKAKPTVRRWSTRLADGRTAINLRIDFPAQPEKWAEGFTVVYSQGDGTKQRRLIATSKVKRGEAPSLGSQTGILEAQIAGEQIVCDVRNGALDVTGPRSSSIVVRNAVMSK